MWFRAIKNLAQQLEIWDYVNPDKTSKPPKITITNENTDTDADHGDENPDPEATTAATTATARTDLDDESKFLLVNEAPTEPKPSSVRAGATSMTDLNQNQCSLYNTILHRYFRQLDEYKDRKQKLLSLSQQIDATISFDLYYITTEAVTPYEKLRRLKQRISPDVETERSLILQRYRQICRTKITHEFRRIVFQMDKHSWKRDSFGY